MLVLRHGNQTSQGWPLSRTTPSSSGATRNAKLRCRTARSAATTPAIFWDGSAYAIEDLGSKNGTHVNGVNIADAPHSLSDGDEVQIALRFKMAFVDDEATTPLTLDTPEPEEEPASGLRIEEETRRVWLNGTLLDPPLSLHQYRLLSALWHEGGGVMTREQIVQAVWPETSGDGVSKQAIDALVRRLRERLSEHDDREDYIITVRGHGFRLENP